MIQGQNITHPPFKKISDFRSSPTRWIPLTIILGACFIIAGCGPAPRIDETPRGSVVYPIRYDFNIDGEIWFKNSTIQLRFDRDMYCRVFLRQNEKLYSINDIPPYEDKAKPPDFLAAQGKEIRNFLVDYRDIGSADIKNFLGTGKQFNLTGYAKSSGGIQLRKKLKIDFYQDYPDIALISASYQNQDPKNPILISHIYSGFYRMDASRADAALPRFSFQYYLGTPGQLLPLAEEFSRKVPWLSSQHENRPPFLDLWCNLMGMGVGLFAGDTPETALMLQVAADARAEMGLVMNYEKELKAGDTLTLPKACLIVHTGDYRNAQAQFLKLAEKLWIK
jgi:hypothetical protein